MRYLRKWDLPTLDEPVIEHLDKIPGWGESLFFYCTRCRTTYASVILHPEDCTSRPWRGIGGLCLTCPPNRFSIRGKIEAAALIGLEVPYEVASYILDREIDFLGHPAHPHNEVAE
jgi:hypothetical protein